MIYQKKNVKFPATRKPDVRVQLDQKAYLYYENGVTEKCFFNPTTGLCPTMSTVMLAEFFSTTGHAGF